MTLFMSAPSGTLHRRLRVDFMDEAGVDGGGILREWLHLVCSQLFADAPGLFSLTSSSAHQGYWITRTTPGKSSKQLQVMFDIGTLTLGIASNGIVFLWWSTDVCFLWKAVGESIT